MVIHESIFSTWDSRRNSEDLVAAVRSNLKSSAASPLPLVGYCSREAEGYLVYYSQLDRQRNAVCKGTSFLV